MNIDQYPRASGQAVERDVWLAGVRRQAEYEIERFPNDDWPPIVLALLAMLANAWDEGRAAERRDWEFTFDLVTPDEDRQPLPNPYREGAQ